MKNSSCLHARILVADDDVLFGPMLRVFLTTKGYDCEHVVDAAGAAAALTQSPFDLLISDIDMPGNRRLELISHLAGMPNPPAIILLTGRPNVDTAIQAVELPVRAYLTKPPDFEEMLRVIEQALENARVVSMVSASAARLEQGVREIGRIKDALAARTNAPAAGACFEAYLNVTLANLVGALGDFAELAHAAVGPRHRQPQLETIALVKALQESVAVLEKTRRHFHSKELCALRKKLEQILGENAGSAPGSQFPVKFSEAMPIQTST